MATYTTEITSSSNFVIDNSATTFLVNAGTNMVTSGIGISEAAKWHLNTIVVNGTITNQGNTEAAIQTFGAETTIQVGSTGVLAGEYGIHSTGAAVSIANNGMINSTSVGIWSSGLDAMIVNNGTITSSQNYAVSLDDGELLNTGKLNGGASVSGNGVLITNSASGVINGMVAVYSDAGETSKTVNAGQITNSSSGWGYYGREGNDTLINTGTIKGAISMGSGNDVFDNRGGTIESDVTGRQGNDLYIIDEAIEIFEYSGEGVDTIQTTVSLNLSSSMYAGQEIEKLTLLGSSNSNLTGNGLNNVITGNGGSNVLDGGSSADTLYGNGGADTLKGGTGADSMVGGDGNDTYFADQATDTATETNSNTTTGGIDTVRFSAQSGKFVLGANIENLILEGTGNTIGNGNSGNNKLTGNSGANQLGGSAGKDVLDGGKGNDALWGGTDADTFVFKTGYGTDTVSDFQNGTDRFDISAWTAITDFNDLKANHVVVSGADIQIVAGSDKMIIKDTALAELTASDFIF